LAESKLEPSKGGFAEGTLDGFTLELTRI